MERKGAEGMNKFKVGDYVIHKSDLNRNIICINEDMLTFINSYARYRSYRLATNIDYIRTLSAKQMAKFIWDGKGHCDYCSYGYKATGGECKHTGKCTDGIVEWLQKPYDGWEV